MNAPALPSPIRFERKARQGEAPRFYAMRIEPDRQLALLANAPRGWVLIITRGSLGTQRRTEPVGRVERFVHLHRACERWGELAMRRRRHGYEEVRHE